MSHQSDINETSEPKPIANSNGVKMIGVNMGEKGSSNKPKVSESRKGLTSKIL